MKKIDMKIGKATVLTRNQLKKVLGGSATHLCVIHCPCPPGFTGPGNELGVECNEGVCRVIEGISITCDEYIFRCSELMPVPSNCIAEI